MQRMALERLMAMCSEDLSPTLAFQMLRMGLEEERAELWGWRALWMKTYATARSTTIVDFSKRCESHGHPRSAFAVLRFAIGPFWARGIDGVDAFSPYGIIDVTLRRRPTLATRNTRSATPSTPDAASAL